MECSTELRLYVCPGEMGGGLARACEQVLEQVCVSEGERETWRCCAALNCACTCAQPPLDACRLVQVPSPVSLNRLSDPRLMGKRFARTTPTPARKFLIPVNLMRQPESSACFEMEVC